MKDLILLLDYLGQESRTESSAFRASLVLKVASARNAVHNASTKRELTAGNLSDLQAHVDQMEKEEMELKVGDYCAVGGFLNILLQSVQ